MAPSAASSGAAPSSSGNGIGSGLGVAGTAIVRKGDTLDSIAQAHGVSVTSIVQANKLTATKTLRPGQRLVIPQ